MKSLFFLFFCFFLLSGCSETSTYRHHIYLEESNFELITDDFFVRKLNFDSLPNEEVVYLTYWGEKPRAEFKFGKKRLLINYQGNVTENIYIEFDNKVKKISLIIQGKPFEYNAAYVQKHSSKVTAEIPEVYELTNIVLALADKFHQTQFGAHTEGEYYRQVIKWFEPFKDHPLFNTVSNVDYYSLVENGPAYVFNDNKIQKSVIYNGFRAKDAVADNVPLLASFAEDSNFKEFYEQQQPYYSGLTEQFVVDTQPKRVWTWLESQFPARYQSYKVFFSPLGAGKHSARMYSDKGFKEALMFISGPNRYKNESEPLSLSAIKLSRSFFTEIDHAYVNPVSDNYIEEITMALPNLNEWYKGGGYNKPYATFNEYMTWSVFMLYAMDTYSDEEYLVIKNYVEDFMVNRRGFYKFPAFNNELLRLYQARRQEQVVTDLYPQIIEWVRHN